MFFLALKIHSVSLIIDRLENKRKFVMNFIKDWTIFFLSKGSKETTLQKHLETKKHLKEAAKIQMKPETKKIKAKANIQNETPKISELSLGEGKLKII